MGIPRVCPCRVSSKDRIRPWDRNKYFWTYKEEPVLLIGGSDEDNLFNHPSLMERNLRVLTKCGGNYTRCTLSCRDLGDLWPFTKIDEKYDLNRFSPEFWRRLRACLRKAYEHDIIAHRDPGSSFP